MTTIRNHMDGYIPFALDWDIMNQADQGIGVIDGCVCSASGTDMLVSYTSGKIKTSAGEVAVSASSVSFAGLQHATYYKKGVVYCDATDQTIKACVGNAETTVPGDKTGRYSRKPEPPDFSGTFDLAAGDVILCEIWLRPTGSYIQAADISDRRIGMANPHLVSGGLSTEVTHEVIAATGQTVDIAQYKKNDGTVVFSLDKDGNSTMNRVLITNTAIGSIPLTIFGASGQTADLLSVKQNGGTVAFSVDKDGNVTQPLGFAGTGPTYVIYKSGSTYYAKKETTGVIVSSNTSAAIVIQFVLDAIGAANGGKIFFKAGIYDVDTGLTYPYNHLTMQGEQVNTSVGSVIRKTAAIDLLTITSGSRKIGYQFDSLYFDGNSRAYAGKLLSITKTSQRLHITNCSFIDNDGQAIYLNDVWGHGPRIFNCFVYGCGSATTPSIEITTDSNAISIRDCGIAPGAYKGIFIEGTAGNIDIDHCIIENDPAATEPMIDIDGMWTTVRGCQFSTQADCTAIDAIGMYPTIVDNMIVNANRTGTGISSVGYPAIISGNHVYGFNKGIVVGGYDVVANNYIDSANTGIYSTHMTMITNNRVINSRYHGIHQFGGGDAIIQGNFVLSSSYGSVGTYSGIALENTSNCFIQNNMSFDPQGTQTQQYGIKEIGSSNNNTIRFNNVNGGYGNQTGGILKLGAGTVVEYNIGHKTENSNISTGTGAQQAIAHGLILTPTRVLLSEYNTGAALPYQSAAADATNIYVTAVLNKTWQWEAKIR